jgi:hypothetical protein
VPVNRKSAFILCVIESRGKESVGNKPKRSKKQTKKAFTARARIVVHDGEAGHSAFGDIAVFFP